MSTRLLERGLRVCRNRGYDVARPEQPWLPPALCEPGDDAAVFSPTATTSTVAVEPLASAETTPTTVLSRLRNNRSHDRFTLFVVDDEAGARECLGVLRDPPLVHAVTETGARTFYNGPDRVALDGGGFAACRTDSAAFSWREVESDATEGRRGSDERQLLLEDDGGVVAVLDGVSDLCCRPSASSFPYSYIRGDDKRFHVRTADGKAVGVYSTIADMRANAYIPVPLPLVPEELFDGIASVRDEWAVLVVGSGAEPAVFGADASL